MAGGLMNLVSVGQQNIMLNGNPSKSFFKAAFRQFTNFGLQKFRLDFEGAKSLRLTEESTFTFKVKRYADLLMDCYLSVALPSIWSPILPPQPTNEQWVPYEFKWIENIGAKIVSKISITCGNYTLQEYSGDYLLAAVQRDFNTTKKALFDEMTGQVPELVDPANANARINAYPNAFFTDAPQGPEPSIRGRVLYIPLNNWFSLTSQMAFPLVALQYNELHIHVTLRPVNQWFVIRDVFDAANQYPYIAPNFNAWYMQMHRFLQPPPNIDLGINDFPDQRAIWNADVHLNCTYAFLCEAEQRLFALTEQRYLIKQIRETRFPNVTGANRVQLDSLGLVCGWLFYFQRSDVNLRNEWSNYSNWPYNYLPSNVLLAPTTGNLVVYRDVGGVPTPVSIGPGVNPDGTLTGLLLSPPFNPQNTKNILVALGILLDGEYRENIQPVGVYDFVEKYTRTTGNAPPGLYCYHFGINSNNANMQPSGAMSMSRFTQIEFEFSTTTPPLDPFAQSLVVCDPQSGTVIGINKPTWNIYDYNFNLHLFEERINSVHFVGGNVGMQFAT